MILKPFRRYLEQYERLNGHQAKEVMVDRGYKGIKIYKGSKIFVPKPDKNITKKQRKKHSKRAAVEPVIGHLKQDTGYAAIILKESTVIT